MVWPSKESNFIIFLKYVFLWIIKCWDSLDSKKWNSFDLQCSTILPEQKVVTKYTDLCILASLLPALRWFTILLLWFYPLQIPDKVGGVCISQLVSVSLSAPNQMANLENTFSLPFFPLGSSWQWGFILDPWTASQFATFSVSKETSSLFHLVCLLSVLSSPSYDLEEKTGIT